MRAAPTVDHQKQANKRLWIPHSQHQHLLEEADRIRLLETGGILLGYWSETQTDAVVTNVVGPGPKAIHRRCSFSPDLQFHIDETARIYTESGRRFGYLGDWHTHPGMPAYLSRQDKGTLRRIARDRKARATQPVMLILGGGSPWEPRAWVGISSGSFWIRKRVDFESVELLLSYELN